MKLKADSILRLQAVEENENRKVITHLTQDEWTLFVHSVIPVCYVPRGTLIHFHKSQALVKLIMGPFGSGKSSACCAEIIHQLCRMPPMLDGVRRARWAIIRNTMGELESTTLLTWLNWFGRLGKMTRRKKPILTLKYEFNDTHGPLELELFFLGLDREDDKQKLESLELTSAYINELQHVPKAIFTHLVGRIGRYPEKDKIVTDYYSQIIADSNPPDVDHWIHADFEVNKIDEIVPFHQPPGLIKGADGEWYSNPDADNVDNLKPNYYLNMAKLNHFNKEFIKVYCQGEYGIVIPGEPVFYDYNDNIHSADNIAVLKNEPIGLMLDYGMTPAALILQLSPQGQLRALKEFVTERSCLKDLAKNVLVPYLNRHYPGMPLIVRGDPADPASQSDNQVCEKILKELGLDVKPAKTNRLQPRLDAGHDFLSRMIDGQPAFQLDREGCPHLRKAFMGKYCKKRIRVIGDEKYRDVPDKTHPWSDVMDCYLYGACEFGGGGFKIIKPKININDFLHKEKY